MKELGKVLCAAMLICAAAVTAEATTRTVQTSSGLMVGVCADFQERHPRSTLHFCAKQDQFNQIFYYFSVNVTTSLPELVVDESTLNVKQVVSKQILPLRFEQSAIVSVADKPPVFLKSYVVEVPQVIIKHLRNGISVDFSYSVGGTVREYNLTPQERAEVRMVALFESLEEE